MSRILIIGHGVVGKNLHAELAKLDPDVVDKYKPGENIQKDIGAGYDLAFICVDTPYTEEDPCGRGEVWNAVRENAEKMSENGVIIIKSTVLPGTTEEIRENTGANVIFSPEYYGGTQHCNNYCFDYTILGGEKADCRRVIQILQEVYDGRHQFAITDSRTAEIVKYMENSWLATKVSFCRQFYEIAENNGVSYEELRELFLMDPRVNPSHTFVYRDHPYWSSHCLNKDVPAIAESENAKFLKAVIQYNQECKASVGR